MSKNILIDSAHAEEIRVAVVNNNKLEKFDFESTSKVQVRGNIYLAKVIRVEPSLQAAFINYGNDRHGFLSFSEIHHNYFQVPIGDREELEMHINNVIESRAAELGVPVEEIDEKEVARLRYQFYRKYKIQEVIKKRQIMLVQVNKEERGNKGAALTTYISLAGRYCVLLPNTEKSSGVSRKVTNQKDRTKLKKIVADLEFKKGSVVLRTAAIGHTKAEIKKDFDYLCRLWDEIRETTLKSIAPCLIHEEAGIAKRAIRDMYDKSVDNIFVEGEDCYKYTKQFMKKIMPSHAKKVQLYSDTAVPLFKKFHISNQIKQIYSTRVDLPSGGYLVINNTEALIAVDVNSGKSTKERNISETALRTNLEAANELARQCRLRDLAGLIVVDFIDMDDKKDNVKVERCLKNAMREDKAKIQIGSITNFGLLELSRQRLRSSIADANMDICPHCHGTGFIWTEESNAIQILRSVEDVCSNTNIVEVRVTLPMHVALYIMNNKRHFLSDIEMRSGVKIFVSIDNFLAASDFKIDTLTKKDQKRVNDDEYYQELDKKKDIQLQQIKKNTSQSKNDLSKNEKSGENVVSNNQIKEKKVIPIKTAVPKDRKLADPENQSEDMHKVQKENKRPRRNTHKKIKVIAENDTTDKKNDSDSAISSDSNTSGDINNVEQANSVLSDRQQLADMHKRVQEIGKIFFDMQGRETQLAPNSFKQPTIVKTATSPKKIIWWQKFLKKSEEDTNGSKS